jgi:hypothetical protein
VVRLRGVLVPPRGKRRLPRLRREKRAIALEGRAGPARRPTRPGPKSTGRH